MQEELRRVWEQERTTLLLVTHDIDEVLFLGDRVVVLRSRPGTVRKVVTVDLPRPRDRTTWEFASLRKTIFREFLAETDLESEYAHLI